MEKISDAESSVYAFSSESSAHQHRDEHANAAAAAAVEQTSPIPRMLHLTHHIDELFPRHRLCCSSRCICSRPCRFCVICWWLTSLCMHTLSFRSLSSDIGHSWWSSRLWILKKRKKSNILSYSSQLDIVPVTCMQPLSSIAYNIFFFNNILCNSLFYHFLAANNW